MRPALVLLLALGACRAAPSELETTHAFVRRSGPETDTLRVGRRADSLAVALELRVLSGRIAWSLVGPDGREAWAGAVGDEDTTAAWAVAAPMPGDWRLVVTPDSAMGVARVRGLAR